MEIKVQKKDGQIETFEIAKVKDSAAKAGASPEEAEKIAAEVQAWAGSVASQGPVKSADIRAKVLEVLRTVNPTAAGKFEGYQKPAA